jgi:hypothetical protein
MEHGRLTFNLSGQYGFDDIPRCNMEHFFLLEIFCAFVNKLADKVNGDKQEKQKCVSKKMRIPQLAISKGNLTINGK